MATRIHYIGIDPSITSTGVAYICKEDGKSVKEKYLHVGSPSKRYPNRSLRYRLISDTIWVMLENIQVRKGDHFVVAFELYAMGGKGQIATLGELQGYLKAKLETVLETHTGCATYEILEIPPRSLKAWATGRGNATKEEMKAHCYARFSQGF